MKRPVFVPDSAPFSGEQRHWINGFLTGLAAVKLAKESAAPKTDPAPRTPLTILYGSQSGNSEALGRDLRKKSAALGFAPEVAELDAFDRSRIPEVKRLLIVTSTFGEGDPPDNARRFCEWLFSSGAPRLPDLHYSVCALGDSNYTQFCKCGIDIDERLAGLGATRIAPRVECDAAYEEPFAAWKQTVFESSVLREAASPAGAAQEAEPPADESPAPGWNKKNPFPGTLLKDERLTGPGSKKEVRHIEISLAGSGLRYKAGDALGVWPVNCPDLVEELLRSGGYSGDEAVELQGEPMPLRYALLRRCDLSKISKPLIAAVSEQCGEAAVRALGNGDGAAWLEERHVVDLFDAFDFHLPAQDLADCLRPLQPRLYSIASSPLAHPGQVHLTVRAVRYESGGRRRKGVASTFLADRLPIGSTVQVYIQPSFHFGLPEDDAAPVIMAGPGTGVAPFRAFLEERMARGAAGRNWLFFGDQRRETDFLYEQELQAMLEAGALTRLDTAFSREQREKVYVQDRMLEHARDIWEWLESGAHFYVCGDASRMAREVDEALHQIVEQQGGLTAGGARAYVSKLKDEKRYQRDVY